MRTTLREWRLPLGLWALVTLLATVVGPFGTFTALTPLARLGYWAGVVGVAVALNVALPRLIPAAALPLRLVARVAYVIVLAGLVHILNLQVFAGWDSRGGLWFLLAVVLLIAVLVELAVWLLRPARAPETAAGPVAQTDPAAAFLRRLPLERRGALIRIEAQDHYLNVVTTRGAALILMRMADAEAELAAVPGLRVHRSHWVAVAAVLRHLRRDGRDLLVMRDGAEVPVSRASRAAVQAAGLIARAP